MGWKTGSQTVGAHYIASLAKTADLIRRVIPNHNPKVIAERDAGEWLKKSRSHQCHCRITDTSNQKPTELPRKPERHSDQPLDGAAM